MSDQSGWASSGWGDVDDELSKPSEGGSGFTRTFSVKVGLTQRFVILADEPFAFYEHGTYGIPNAPAFDNPICLNKNGKLSETFGKCPFCEASDLHKETKGAQGRESWATYVGRVTVIDCGTVTQGVTGTVLTGWVNNEGKEFNFDRKIMALKKGGKDKPGLLLKFRRFREKRGGSLVGCVYDSTRSGTKEETAGTEWDFVGKIDVSTVDKLKAGLKSLEGYRPDVHDVCLEKNVTAIGALPYGDLFKPRTRKDLQNILAGKGPLVAGQSASHESTAFDGPSGSTPTKSDGYQAPDAPDAPDTLDEDIPF